MKLNIQYAEGESKGKILYLMGGLYFGDVLFADTYLEDNTATLLSRAGYDVYWFDNYGTGPGRKSKPVADGHFINVDFAAKAIEEYDIDFIIAYCYGARIAEDTLKLVDVKGLVILDRYSADVRPNTYEDSVIVLTKEQITSYWSDYDIDNRHVEYLVSIFLGDDDIVEAGKYPGKYYKDEMDLEYLASKTNVLLVNTASSTRVDASFPNQIAYPDASHIIFIEKTRYKLVTDIVNFFNKIS